MSFINSVNVLQQSADDFILEIKLSEISGMFFKSAIDILRIVYIISFSYFFKYSTYWPSSIFFCRIVLQFSGIYCAKSDFIDFRNKLRIYEDEENWVFLFTVNGIIVEFVLFRAFKYSRPNILFGLHILLKLLLNNSFIASSWDLGYENPFESFFLTSESYVFWFSEISFVRLYKFCIFQV